MIKLKKIYNKKNWLMIIKNINKKDINDYIINF